MRTLAQRYQGINIYRTTEQGQSGAPGAYEALVQSRPVVGSLKRVKRKIDAAVAALPKLRRSKWQDARIK